MNIIYLDNAATTKPYDEVFEIAENVLKENYFNPSAVYNKAVNLSKEINKVRSSILNSVNASEGNIIFTSGGSESINSVINSFSGRAKKIITTEYEHSATLNALENLKNRGFDIVKIKAKDKKINIDDILDAIDENTVLVSVMHVNNEVGNIIDIEELGKKIKQKNDKVFFHIDAVQAYMKLKINVDRAKVDFLSISGHKIHAIKGIGALYIRNINKFNPLIFGGGQEFGLRSGTDNVFGVLSLGKAVEIGIANFDKNAEKLSLLRKCFLENISNVKDYNINSAENGASHILNISFLGVPSEILLHDLENKGIYVSAGSACSSKKKGSKTLGSLGFSEEVKKSAIRFSFSNLNTEEEIIEACNEIKKSVDSIRKITKYKG